MKYFDFRRLDQHDFAYGDHVEYDHQKRVISMVSECRCFIYLDGKQASGGFHQGPLTRHDLHHWNAQINQADRGNL